MKREHDTGMKAFREDRWAYGKPKMWRRCVAAMLSCVLLFSGMPLVAYAEETEHDAVVEEETANVEEPEAESEPELEPEVTGTEDPVKEDVVLDEVEDAILEVPTEDGDDPVASETETVLGASSVGEANALDVELGTAATSFSISYKNEPFLYGSSMTGASGYDSLVPIVEDTAGENPSHLGKAYGLPFTGTGNYGGTTTLATKPADWYVVGYRFQDYAVQWDAGEADDTYIEGGVTTSINDGDLDDDTLNVVSMWSLYNLYIVQFMSKDRTKDPTSSSGDAMATLTGLTWADPVGAPSTSSLSSGNLYEFLQGGGSIDEVRWFTDPEGPNAEGARELVYGQGFYTLAASQDQAGEMAIRNSSNLVTLYPYLPVDNMVDIEYYGNGADDTNDNVKLSQPTQQIAKGASDTVKSPSATLKRTGYSFLGWSTDKNAATSGADILKPGDALSVPADQSEAIKLYAIWGATTYTVKYHDDFYGSDASTTNATFTEGTDGTLRTLTSDSGTAAGYEFVGWTDSRTGLSLGSGTPKWTGGQKASPLANPSSDNTDSVDLYPVYKLISYTLRFTGGEASGAAVTQTVTGTSGTSALAATPTTYSVSGKDFKGWARTGTSTVVLQGTDTINYRNALFSGVSNGGTVEVQAVFEASSMPGPEPSDEYTVVYMVGPYQLDGGEFKEITPDANGMGTAYGSSYTATFKYGEDAVMPNPYTTGSGSDFWVTGYVFAGWVLLWPSESGSGYDFDEDNYWLLVGDGAGRYNVESAEDLEEANTLRVAALWKPYEDYQVRFFSADATKDADGKAQQSLGSFGNEFVLRQGLTLSSGVEAPNASNLSALPAGNVKTFLNGGGSWGDITWTTSMSGPSATGAVTLSPGSAFKSLVPTLTPAVERALRTTNTIDLYPYLPVQSFVDVNYYANRTSADNRTPLDDPKQSIAKGSSAVVKDADLLTRPGYHLVGWSYSAGTGYTDTANILVPGTSTISIAEDAPDSPASLYAVWAPNTYTVRLHNGYYDGDNATTTVTKTIGATPAQLPASTVDKTAQGYTFAGWSKVEPASLGEGTPAYSVGASVGDIMTASETTADGLAGVDLYPVYERAQVTVTFHNAKGATALEREFEVTREAGATGQALPTAPAVAADGYYFDGWYSDPSMAAQYFVGTKHGTSKTVPANYYEGTLVSWPTTDTDLYAKWLPVTGYVLNYASAHQTAGGKPSVGAHTGSGSTLTWEATSLLPAGSGDLAVDGSGAEQSSDGYTFLGWYSKVDADGVPAADAVKLSQSTTYAELAAAQGATSDSTSVARTAYAGWEPAPAKVIYLNGAFTAGANERTPLTGSTDSPANAASYSEDRLTGDELILSTTKFQLAGYAFNGYKLESAPSGATYGGPSGSAYKVAAVPAGTADASNANRLVAQWAPIAYTVKFNGGSGSSLGTGHTSADTAKAMTYDVLNGTLPGDDLFAKGSQKLVGWECNGTTYAAGANWSDVGNLTTEDGSTVTMNAVWAPAVTYSFYPNGGVLDIQQFDSWPDDVTVASGGTLAGSDIPEVPGAISRQGYLPDGWTTNADGTGTAFKHGGASVTAPAVSAATTIPLYVKWVPQAAKATLDFHDGTPGDAVRELSGVTGQDVNLPAEPTREGYTFAGWSTADDNAIGSGDLPSGTATYKLPAGTSTVLHAVWQGNAVTVKFDKNAQGRGTVSGAIADMSVNVGASATLPASTYSLPGYTFKGWADEANATTADYADGATVNPVPVAWDDATTHAKTVYAVWEADEATLTYHGNGGKASGADSKQHSATVHVGDEVALDDNAFAREGHAFAGWASAVDANGKAAAGATTYDENGRFTVSATAADNNVYALWTANKYDIKFATDDEHATVSDTGKVAEGTYGESLTAEQFNAARAAAGVAATGNYYIVGWKVDGVEVSPWDYEIKGDTTFYPVVRESWTVTYKAGEGGDFASQSTPELKAGTGTFPAFTGTAKAAYGYAFADKWLDAANGNAEVGHTDLMALAGKVMVASDPTAEQVVGADHEYVAQFSRLSFGVNVKQPDSLPDGASVTPLGTDLQVEYESPLGDQAQAIAGTVTVPEGYELVGWDYKMQTGVNPDNDDPVYAESDEPLPTADLATLEVLGATELTPVIRAKAVSVTFDAAFPGTDEGATTAAYPGDAKTGDALALSGTESMFAAPEGYAFAGWATAFGGSAAYAWNGTAFAPAATAALPAAGLALFASWTALPTKVVYDKGAHGSYIQGGAALEVTAKPSGANLVTGDSYAVIADAADANVKADDGYTFTGWELPDGTAAPASIASLPATSLTLTAAYTRAATTIVYDPGSAVKAEGVTNDDLQVAATAGEMVPTWTADKVNAGFNDGPYFLKPGYAFNGWKMGGDDIAAGAPVTMPDDGTNVTLVAQWSPAQATIALDPQGGAFDGMAAGAKRTESGATDATLTLSLADAPQRAGYTFTGYSYTAKADGAAPDIALNETSDEATVTFGRIGSDGPLGEGVQASATLYATYSINGYDVNYYENKDNPATKYTPAGQVPYEGEATVLPLAATGFSAEPGHLFKGWAASVEDAEAGTVAYAAADLGEGPTFAMPAGDVDFYAVWAKKAVTLRFYGSAEDAEAGGAPVAPALEGEFGDTVPRGDLPQADAFADEDNHGILIGWTDGDGHDFNVDGTAAEATFPDDPDADAPEFKLYPKWKTYQVTYKRTSSDESPVVVDVYWDTPLYRAPSDENPPSTHVFNGWAYNIAGGRQAFVTQGADATFGEAVQNLAGAPVSPAANTRLTLTESWTVTGMLIEYAPNAPQGAMVYNSRTRQPADESIMDRQQFGEGFGGSIAAPDYVAPGYAFAGWAYAPAADSNGGTWPVEYAPATLPREIGDPELSRLTDMVDDELGITLLYARWQPKTDFKVVFAKAAYDGQDMGDAANVLSTADNLSWGTQVELASGPKYDAENDTNFADGVEYGFVGWHVAQGYEDATADDAVEDGTAYSALAALESDDVLYEPAQIALYPMFAAKASYTVRFNANAADDAAAGTDYLWRSGDSGAHEAPEPYTQTLTSDASVAQALAANGFARAGYEFAGWAKTEDGPVAYADEYEIAAGTDLAADVEADGSTVVDLFAVWTPKGGPDDPSNTGNLYKVTWLKADNATTFGTSENIAWNGAVSAPSGDISADAASQALLAEGWAFNGWYTAADNADTHANAGVKLGSSTTYKQLAQAQGLDDTGSEPVVMYPHFSHLESTLSFEANGATSGDAPANLYGDAGDEVEVPGAGDLKKTGATFGGWKAADGTVYDEGDSFEFPAAGEFTLTAVWDDVAYPVHYVDSDGSAIRDATSTWDGALNLTAPALREGKAFAGWVDGNGDAVAAGTKFSQAAANAGLDDGTAKEPGITLRATWTDQEYTVVYDLNLTNDRAAADAAHPVADQAPYETRTDVKWADGVLPAAPPARTGYDFLGWNVELIAGWDAAKGEAGTVVAGSGGTRAGTLDEAFGTVAKHLYPAGTAQALAEASPANAIVLHAQWREQRVDVTYQVDDADHGQVALHSAPSAWGSSLAESLAAVSGGAEGQYGAVAQAKGGYKFVNWTVEYAVAPDLTTGALTTAAAGEPALAEPVLMTAASEEAAADADLYPAAAGEDQLIRAATYTANFRALETYKISFDPNSDEATGTVPDVIATEDTPATLPDGSDFTREGYHVSAWTTNPDGTGQSYAPGGTAIVGADTQLYAQWEKDKHTVTFEQGTGGTVQPGSIEVEHGDAVSADDVKVTPDRGYEHDGWDVSTDGGKTWTHVEGMSLGGVKISGDTVIRPTFKAVQTNDDGPASDDTSKDGASGDNASSGGNGSTGGTGSGNLTATGDPLATATALALAVSAAMALLLMASWVQRRRREEPDD